MPKSKRFVEFTLFLLILGLALFLRMRRLDTTGIWGDQSFTLNTALRWVKGGAMPLAANKSSVGFMNPPMIEYLYAGALRIWPDVLSVALLTLISGMVAIATAGWATYEVFGKRAAFWAMLIFAFNPWSVYYSQLIWNQTMVPVFSTLTVVSLLLYFAVKQRPAYLILSFVWAACMTQVHPGTGIQLVTMGIIFAVFWRRLRIWPLVVGSALFVLLYVPFLLYERGVNWIDLNAILQLARQPAPFSIAAVLLSIDLVRVQGLTRSSSSVVLFDDLAAVLLGLSLVYALWAGGRAFRRRRDDEQAMRRAAGFFILLLWFIIPILFYLRSSQYLQIYYLIGQLPAPFVLMGVLFDDVQHSLQHLALRMRQQPLRRIIHLVAGAVLPLSLLVLIGWQVAFNLQIQDARFHSKSRDRWQIRHVRAAIQMVRQLLTDRPECSLVVVSEGHNLEVSQLSMLREFTYPERILLTDGRSAIPLATSCTVYLDALPESRASKWLETVAIPLLGAEIQALGATWRFYDLPASAQASLVAGDVSAEHVATWTHGVALTEYSYSQVHPGSDLSLTLTWLISDAPREVVYHIGAYLLTTDNQVVAQSDGPGFDSIQWRQGDRFITWFDIPVPQDIEPGTYQIALAWYSWPAIERVSLTSGENTFYLAQVQVPPP